MTEPVPTDPAKQRFWVLQLLRLSGGALALLGIAAMTGKVDLPWAAGAVLFAVGVFDLLIFPLVLARRWRTPRP